MRRLQRTFRRNAKATSPQNNSPITSSESVEHHDRSVIPLKIVLAGPGLSGKSTIIRQLRLAFGSGFQDDERRVYAGVVRWNVRMEMLGMIGRMQEAGISFQRSCSQQQWDFVEGLDMERVEDDSHVDEVRLALKALLEDTGFQRIFVDNAQADVLYTNSSHYLADLDRIFSKEYLPTDQDIVSMRLFTEGITGTTLDIDGLGVQLLDMGGIRSERKHWVHVCPHADAIVLVVSMSAFSNYLTEDIHTNQLYESIRLCKSVAEWDGWGAASFFVLFTHVDRFREYVAAGLLPLSRFFPDYDAENEDVAAAQDFITEKVTGPVSRIKPVRSFFVNALDTNSVETAWRAIMKHSFATRVTPIGKR